MEQSERFDLFLKIWVERTMQSILRKMCKLKVAQFFRKLPKRSPQQFQIEKGNFSKCFDCLCKVV